MRRFRRLPFVGELVDAEHELHGIAGRLLDRLDQTVVHEERNPFRRPLGRTEVELAGVDGDGLHGELVADGRITKGMQAHADAHLAGRHVPPEDLADTDLRRRTGEHAGLQRGDPGLAAELRTPWRLVRLDDQPQEAITEPVPGGRRLAGAPLRQVVRQPARLVQVVTVEGVLERKLVARLPNHEPSIFPRARRLYPRPAGPKLAQLPAASVPTRLCRTCGTALPTTWKPPDTFADHGPSGPAWVPRSCAGPPTVGATLPAARRPEAARRACARPPIPESSSSATAKVAA